jgi:hypothetical protein
MATDLEADEAMMVSWEASERMGDLWALGI